MSAVTWRAGVAIPSVTGTTPLQVTDDDAAAQATRPAAGTLRLLAPLMIGESIDDQLWPAQPRGYGRFSLLANTAAELGEVVKGTPVVLAWKSNRDPANIGDPDHIPPIPFVPWDIKLYGVVDTAKIRPWWSGGVVGEFTVVDYRVGLLGTDDTGTADWPSETHTARVARILGANGVDWVGVSPSPAVDPNMVARASSRTTKLDALETTLREWVDTDAGTPVGRPVCVASVNITSADTSGLTATFRRWNLLRQQRQAAGSSTSTVITPDGQGAVGEIELPARLVEFASASWQHGNDQPTKLSCTWSNAGVQATNTAANADHGPGGLTVVIETSLQANVAANRVVDLYLPDAGLTRWVADSFNYVLDRDTTDNPVLARVGQVVTITDIELGDNPANATVYAGRVTTAELLVEAGQVSESVTLLPALSSSTSVLDGLFASTTIWALSLDGDDATPGTYTYTFDGGTA